MEELVFAKEDGPVGEKTGEGARGLTVGPLKVCVRLSVTNPSFEGDSAFGPGVAELCRGVRETGSLYAAAKRMKMAYSKAWRVMKSTEEMLGTPLLVRDGARGSRLTPEGAALLDAYLEVDEWVAGEAQRLFVERMAGFVAASGTVLPGDEGTR